MDSPQILSLIPLCPLLGAGILGLRELFRGVDQSSKETEGQAHYSAFPGVIATLFSTLAFLLSVLLFFRLDSQVQAVTATLWNWIKVGTLALPFALRFDYLSAVMSLVICGVGSLIHLYALGYMAHDPAQGRFFCYLNLFLFAMLTLVLGENLLVLFVGWEGVGLCSYLLIGFWYKEQQNAVAGQKAFVVNRIGDAGFILGCFVLLYAVGSLNIDHINAAATRLPVPMLELAALLLFIGAVGKSAQIPLYVWLPDAMAGPTPVSALIHAATMVTAGIYLITRLSPLYALCPFTSLVICGIGALTALFAASIALAQNDIKKVLAYSTVSQLGYMFMALGAGAYSNGIYHVVTHAFFKACLFMGAGSVIVGCHHEQDMRHFGGLRKTMKLTFITYFVATLAIAGIPPLSGFYSKDAILWTVISNQGPGAVITFFGLPLNTLFWLIGIVTAFLTAFYMTRSLVLTFFGQYRGHYPAHESPLTMTLPLLVLMVLSFGFAKFYGGSLLELLKPWTRADMQDLHQLEQNHLYHTLEVISIFVAFAGVGLSFFIYSYLPSLVDRLASSFHGLHRALLNKWWIDELYQLLVIQPLQRLAQVLFSVVDRFFVDGLVNGFGALCLVNGEVVRRMHSGRIAGYLLFMFLAVVCSVVFCLLL